MNIKSNLKDKDMICKSCQKPFVLTVDEQEFLIRKGLAPFTHCKPCRRVRRKEARKIMRKELSKNKQNFMKALNAVEAVKMEVVPGPEVEHIVHKEQVSVGLVSAEKKK